MVHKKRSKPSQVGIHGDTVNGEAAAVHARNSLELLNLAPDLVRHSFHEIVRLKHNRWSSWANREARSEQK